MVRWQLSSWELQVPDIWTIRKPRVRTQLSFPSHMDLIYANHPPQIARDENHAVNFKKKKWSTRLARSLQGKEGHGKATDEGNGASSEVRASTRSRGGDGRGARGAGLRLAEASGGGRRDGGGGRGGRGGADDSGGDDRRGRGGSRGEGRGGGGSRGARGRARGQADGLGARGGANSDGRLAVVLATIILSTLDLEGERVLEDALVALEGEDKAVGSLVAEGRVDSPLVSLIRVGNATCKDISFCFGVKSSRRL